MESVDYVEYVRASDVRVAVLDAVRAESRETRRLVSDLDASESAVYAAVNDLADRRLLVDDDGALSVTGLGEVVGEFLDRQRRTQSLLATDPDYWATHDVTAVPRCHRRFEALSDATVLRATDADPNRVTRAISRRVRDAEEALVLAPIYHDEYVDAVGEVDDVRLVLDPDAVAEVADDAPEPADVPPVRLHPLSFALTVTDDCVLLSLPGLDGGYDAQAEVIAESESALAWGRDVFEAIWADAEPVGDATV